MSTDLSALAAVVGAAVMTFAMTWSWGNIYRAVVVLE